MKSLILALILMVVSSAWAGPEMLLMAVNHQPYTVYTFETGLSPWASGILYDSSSFNHTSGGSHAAYAYFSGTFTALTLTSSPATVAGTGYFWYNNNGSSGGTPTLKLNIDGATVAIVSASATSWTQYTFAVPSGVHEYDFLVASAGPGTVTIIDDIGLPTATSAIGN